MATETSTSTSKPTSRIQIIDSIPTISISSNSVIRKKVTQCLSSLRIITPTTIAELNGKKGSQKIIALRTTHPSAGSKAITIAEIVKRCIAESSDGAGKRVWWQYNKLESELVELPPRKPALKAETVKGDDKVRDKSNAKPGVTAANTNKRKQDGQESRASKRPKLDSSQSLVDSTVRGSIPKPNPKKRRYQTDDADEDSSGDEDDDTPAHLKSDNLQSDDAPSHLEDSADDMDTDGIPPHLRKSSPDVPPHLRTSSPALYSDTKPGFLRDSTPGGDVESDDIPPHLQGTSPVRNRDGSSTPKPTARGKGRTLVSSPPVISAETPKQAQEEEEDEVSNEDSNSSDEDDGYRRFSYLDIEHLPEKRTKRILEDIDEAERNRKKYRAIAIMTIYISLEKREDFEKLYGSQTNAGEKTKGQEVKSR
ncbi:hypothetical protein TWF481_004752 [Arthrobotrys musiformis]|uniref:DNA/RNA-binding protein Alba-like domain-containing protein n=1 Tax=Arthrobotrys musiformis TaxID=47236 RepID=A0AAV9WMH3_9PEZI